MDQRKITELLTSHAFFKGLPGNVIDALARRATEQKVDAQHLIFGQDDPANHFYLILEGEAAIEIPALAGAPLEIQRLGANAVLGWSWAIPPYRWSFNARALTPARLLSFDGQALLAECEQDPRLGYELVKRFASLMSERLDAARIRIIEEYAPVGAP